MHALFAMIHASVDSVSMCYTHVQSPCSCATSDLDMRLRQHAANIAVFAVNDGVCRSQLHNNGDVVLFVAGLDLYNPLSTASC